MTESDADPSQPAAGKTEPLTGPSAEVAPPEPGTEGADEAVADSIAMAPAAEARAASKSGGTSPDAPLLRRTGRRLVAWSALTMLVVLIVLGAALYGAVARSLAATSESQLAQRAQSIATFLTRPPDSGSRGGPFGFVFGGQAPGTVAVIVTSSGQVIGPPIRLEGLPNQAGIAAAVAGATDVRTGELTGSTTISGPGSGSVPVTIERTTIPVRVYSLPVKGTDGTLVVQVAQDISAEQRALNALLVVLLIGGFVAIAAAVVGGRVYATRALVPIRESLRRQREFAADASHELRTPLSVIRANVEHFERHPERRLGEETDALADVRAEVDHLTALVGDLLLLARTDSGTEELAPEPLDLEPVVREGLDGLRAIAAERSIALDLDAQAAPLTGDRNRLRQLATILTDNAIRHGPAGSRVRIGLQPRDKGGATLTVEDQGPGIRPEDRARVFDRFWRAPGASAGGTGLGLAIAQWVVDRHGGTIEVADAPGGGARFEVRLPARPPG
jgi:signal transduction histidine kinase